MAIALAPIFKKAYFTLAAGGALYLLFVLSLSFPTVQRIALYAHKVNPTLWQDISDPRAFGFLPHQVQPFTLRTSDNETLYAWHILPFHLVQDHAAELAEQAEKNQDDDTVKTSGQILNAVSLKLLASDPKAHIVVNFHGNAAHLASGHRPVTYQRLLGLSRETRPVHVIAFDYRGFGLSSGSPTEQSLITDGETVMSFLTGLSPAGNPAVTPLPSLQIPPQNIILTSQSLGTATSTGLLHRWTLIHNLPSPKGLILMCPFSSLPTLIDSYSIAGVIPPLLSPFRSYKVIMNWITTWMVDTWHTERRLGEILATAATAATAATVGDDRKQQRQQQQEGTHSLSIELIHAKNDHEIPWWEAQRLWDQAITFADKRLQLGDESEVNHQQGSSSKSATASSATGKRGTVLAPPSPPQRVQTWQPVRHQDDHDHDHDRDGPPIQAKQRSKITARFTITPYGGHNGIAISEEAMAAVWRILEA